MHVIWVKELSDSVQHLPNPNYVSGAGDTKIKRLGFEG